MGKTCYLPKIVFASIVLISQAILAQPTITVGVVIDGPWERNSEIRQMTETEILTLTQGEFDVRFPDEKIIAADWTLKGIRETIDKLLADPEVDFVITMGVVASTDICRRGPLPKPAIAPFVIDARLQGLPESNGTSGIPNLNYLSLPSPIVRDIKVFREIVPFTNVAILMNSLVVEALPDLPPRIQAALQQFGVRPKVIPVGWDLAPVLESLEGVEAVYVAPLLHLQSTQFDKLVQTLTEKKLPSFSLIGVNEVQRGLMATMSPDMFPKITRRVALNFQRILLGEKPEALPTAFAVGERLTINVGVTRAIDVSPPFSVLTEAQVINERRKEVTRNLNIVGVMREAIAENLDLRAERQRVAAGEGVVAEARAILLPQLSVSGLGVLIDDDRAEASLGAQAERTLSGSATFSQLLYSERAWGGLSIQKQLQEIRKQEELLLHLDVAQEAATVFLNVLRAKTFEKLQKENLFRTRANLELAEVRQAIGHSGRSEVFRWESEVALDRNEVIRANAQRNLAEIALNRILNEPAESSFTPIDIDFDDPTFGVSCAEVIVYLDDPVAFKKLRTFMALEGLKSSPEIKILDAAIAAKRRELTSVHRSFWSPTLALQADLSRNFKRGGAGTTNGLSLPPTLPLMLPQANDTDWSITLNASLPIFEGGRRFAEKTTASKELAALELDHKSISEKIEQRIRAALHIAGASRAGIKLTRHAADAAKENLELVTDAYSSGVLDILDLLDAQNAALNADLGASSAVYDFLIDLMEAERAVGHFFFDISDEQLDDLLDRLQNFQE